MSQKILTGAIIPNLKEKFSKYYTKAETNELVSAIPKFAIAVVEALPTADISDTTVYLVKSGEETQNLYTEYIYVNDEWEELGKQTVDLTDYYTKTEVDTNFVSTQKVVQELGSSTENLMSQNAVTQVVGDIQTILESI